MKERSVEIEKDGIIHVLQVDEEGNPIAGKKKDNVVPEKKKTVWLEWQFYVFLFIYFLLHTAIRYFLLSSSSLMGLLHFFLVEETYRNIWLEEKTVTIDKIGKTALWLIGGNLILFAIAIIIALLLDL
jgi:ABC-type phosphate transport system permease subunit